AVAGDTGGKKPAFYGAKPGQSQTFAGSTQGSYWPFRKTGQGSLRLGRPPALCAGAANQDAGSVEQDHCRRCVEPDPCPAWRVQDPGQLGGNDSGNGAGAVRPDEGRAV